MSRIPPPEMAYRMYPSPNDSPRDGTIHPIALRQLGPYQEKAATWPLYPDGRAMRCKRCEQSAYFTCDPYGQEYAYTEEEIMGLITAHIRQVHPDE